MNVLCYIPESRTPSKIYLPTAISGCTTVLWYHFSLNHIGMMHAKLSFHTHHPNNVDEAALIIDTALQTAALFARAAIHGSLKITPGTLMLDAA
jgi:hypothetical protein